MAVGAERSTHNLVPVAHTFVEDCETPVSACLKLRGQGPAFLLESAEERQRVGRPLPRPAQRGGRGLIREEPTFEPNMSRPEFEAMVARIVEYVHAGDAFQVVPSQRWSAQVPVEAFSIYRGLRAVNPSPYMYFLDFEDFQLV